MLLEAGDLRAGLDRENKFLMTLFHHLVSSYSPKRFTRRSSIGQWTYSLMRIGLCGTASSRSGAAKASGGVQFAKRNP